MASRPIPDDFVAMHQTCRSMAGLIRHYKASSRTVARWMDHHQLDRSYQPNPIPPPEDYKLQAPIMTKAQLSRLYNVSDKTVSRWAQETGVHPIRGKQRGFRLPKLATDISLPRRDTPQDLAADYLRRFMPVSKCLPDGRWRANGTHYRCGNTIVDMDGLMSKADYYRRKHG